MGIIDVSTMGVGIMGLGSIDVGIVGVSNTVEGGTEDDGMGQVHLLKGEGEGQGVRLVGAGRRA